MTTSGNMFNNYITSLDTEIRAKYHFINSFYFKYCRNYYVTLHCNLTKLGQTYLPNITFWKWPWIHHHITISPFLTQKNHFCDILQSCQALYDSSLSVKQNSLLQWAKGLNFSISRTNSVYLGHHMSYIKADLSVAFYLSHKCNCDLMTRTLIAYLIFF